MVGYQVLTLADVGSMPTRCTNLLVISTRGPESATISRFLCLNDATGRHTRLKNEFLRVRISFEVPINFRVMRYGSVLVLEASGEGSTPSILTNLCVQVQKWPIRLSRIVMNDLVPVSVSKTTPSNGISDHTNFHPM